MYKTLSAPLTVQIELTTKCTNKCVHCYNFWRNDTDHKNTSLSLKQISTILQKICNAKVFDITITGGEPLLNKKGLLFCLQGANRYELDFSLNSNLMPLTPNYIKELRRLGLKHILTSLLGPNAEIHDTIVQKSGAFSKTIQNIKLALKEGIGITVNMVVSSLNLKYIRETAKLVASLGVKKFAATRAGCPGNCLDFSNLSITLEEFRRYLNDLYEAAKEFNLAVDVLESYPLCGIRDLDIYKKFLGRKCLAGVTNCTIGSDGSVRPCSHLDISYGNIFYEELNAIWGKMENWRKGEFLPTICKQCQLIGLCGGGCRMEAKMRQGKISEPDPYSAPEDVKFCLRFLKEEVNKRKEIIDLKKNTDFFMLNENRWREESFGTVVTVGKKQYIFLDHNGTSVFKQFRRGVVYNIHNADIKWGVLKPENFISELAKKKVISFIERREV